MNSSGKWVIHSVAKQDLGDHDGRLPMVRCWTERKSDVAPSRLAAIMILHRFVRSFFWRKCGICLLPIGREVLELTCVWSILQLPHEDNDSVSAFIGPKSEIRLPLTGNTHQETTFAARIKRFSPLDLSASFERE